MMQIVAVIAIIAFIGFFSKFVDSTLGLGYGTILAPVLIIVGYPIYRVVPAVLMSEFMGAGLTALLHRLMGNIDSEIQSEDFKVSTLLSVLGIIAGATGVLIAVNLNELFVATYVSITVIVTGTMVVQGFRWRFSWHRLTAFGFIASLNKSISGGGYGPLVAGGQILSGRDSTKAIGTTAVAEAAVTGAAWLMYYYLGITDLVLDPFLELEIPLVIGALISAPVSALLINRIDAKTLTPLVGSAAVALGVYVLLQIIVGDIFAATVTVAIFLTLMLVISVIQYRRRAWKDVRNFQVPGGSGGA